MTKDELKLNKISSMEYAAEVIVWLDTLPNGFEVVFRSEDEYLRGKFVKPKDKVGRPMYTVKVGDRAYMVYAVSFVMPDMVDKVEKLNEL